MFWPSRIRTEIFFLAVWGLSVAWLSSQSTEGKVVWTETPAPPSPPLVASVPSHSHEPPREWPRCRLAGVWWWKAKLQVKCAYCSAVHQCTSWRIHPHCPWRWMSWRLKTSKSGLTGKKLGKKIMTDYTPILSANRCILNLLFLCEACIICKHKC